MPSPVFQYNKPFSGLTLPSTSHLQMVDRDNSTGGQAGSFYRSVHPVGNGRSNEWPLSPIPSSIIGHLFPSAADMQVCIGHSCGQYYPFSLHDRCAISYYDI